MMPLTCKQRTLPSRSLHKHTAHTHACICDTWIILYNICLFVPRIRPTEVRTPSRQGTFPFRLSGAPIACSASVRWATEGNGSAVWTAWSNKTNKCVIYSFGINGESSFESTLLKRAPGCDYSVNSWGPEITSNPELRDRAHFKPFALGGTNNHDDHDDLKYWTLDSLMDLNGLTFINALKIDIEGGELDTLTAFLSAHAAAEGDVLPVGQLQLEIHAREGHENFGYFACWWAGLRPFWTEPNLVYINLVRRWSKADEGVQIDAANEAQKGSKPDDSMTMRCQMSRPANFPTSFRGSAPSFWPVCSPSTWMPRVPRDCLP
ncbi:hypothetical protein EDB84DRAFT_398331 [Lactarius hengduanensis]|nr:hypothetical protein EDB84DRAFT_398331 [Lactarius hengduanensis]